MGTVKCKRQLQLAADPSSVTVRRRQLQLAGVTAVPSSVLLLVKLGVIPSDSENVY